MTPAKPWRNTILSPRPSGADETLLRLAEEACQAVLEEPFHFHVGRIATGDQFVESKAVKDDIVSRTHPLCVEMEGAAVGQIAVMNNKPFLVIRSMSDNAEDNANDLYDNFIELARVIRQPSFWKC